MKVRNWIENNIPKVAGIVVFVVVVLIVSTVACPNDPPAPTEAPTAPVDAPDKPVVDKPEA